MNLIDDAVAALRAEWTERFIDTVDVTRIGNRGTFNETTLAYDTPIDAGIYSGVALIRPGTTEDAQRLVGGESVSVVAMRVFLPYDTVVGQFGIQVGDRVERTVPPTTGAVELFGVPLYVEAFEYDAYKTRLRLLCSLNLGGATHGN